MPNRPERFNKNFYAPDTAGRKNELQRDGVDALAYRAGGIPLVYGALKEEARTRRAVRMSGVELTVDRDCSDEGDEKKPEQHGFTPLVIRGCHYESALSLFFYALAEKSPVSSTDTGYFLGLQHVQSDGDPAEDSEVFHEGLDGRRICVQRMEGEATRLPHDLPEEQFSEVADQADLASGGCDHACIHQRQRTRMKERGHGVIFHAHGD